MHRQVGDVATLNPYYSLARNAKGIFGNIKRNFSVRLHIGYQPLLGSVMVFVVLTFHFKSKNIVMNALTTVNTSVAIVLQARQW